ncbi:uncharacterized protein [Equus caballus]|uniref:uncharacterized protein isoform X2 n=1 Tax=Equus caballus TaxID=9796 RepID=UPI0038B340DD
MDIDGGEGKMNKIATIASLSVVSSCEPPGRTQNTSVSYLPGAICLTPREVFTNRSIKETRQLGGRGWEEEVNKLGTVCGGVGLAPHGLLCFRLDKMSFFSSWMKAIFVLALLFPLHSESGLSRKRKPIPAPPDCDVLLANPDLCDGQYYPICATNKKTYANPCFFCSQKTGFAKQLRCSQSEF